MATDVEISLPALHRTQREVLNNLKRFSVLCCGRRWGKTTLVFDIITRKLLEGKQCAYICPTYKDDTATATWGLFKSKLAAVTKKKYDSSPRTLELITGGRLVFWALTSIDAFRGGAYDFVAIDECAFAPTLEQSFNEVIQPTLIDRKGGAILVSTPKGMNGFFNLYSRGVTGVKDWASFHYTTSDNPYIAREEIELARMTMPASTFEQEIEAKFIARGGAVFRDVDAVSVALPQEPRAGGDYVMGVDWGKDNDYTALCVIDVKTKTQVALDRFNTIGWQVQRDRIKALSERWRVKVIYAESNSIGSPNIESLQNEGLKVIPFTTTAQSKREIIESLALAIEKRDITLLNDSVQRHELLSYTMTRTASGSYTYSAPVGGHDDTVMALAIAWHAVKYHAGTLMTVIDF